MWLSKISFEYKFSAWLVQYTHGNIMHVNKLWFRSPVYFSFRSKMNNYQIPSDEPKQYKAVINDI